MSWHKKIYLFIVSIFLIVLISCSNNQLDWNEENGYRWAELNTSFFGSDGFEPLSPEVTNITFSNNVSEELIQSNRHYLNGSGVAVADVDGDGLQDIYFAAIDGTNKLYKNLGNFEFEDITEEAGLTHSGTNSTGVVFADVNGDQLSDLLITSLSDNNALYINNGDGTFSLRENSGLGESNGAMSMALADVNGDGSLDLYITNYKALAAKDIYSVQELTNENTLDTFKDGKVQVKPEFQRHFSVINLDGKPVRVENGTADEFYLNDGNGFFTKADPSHHFLNYNNEGMELPLDWGLSATFRDVNNDLLPDLYVANDFWTPDRFWINQGNGIFKLIDSLAVRNVSYSAMGVDFADINRDGHLDYVVTEMLSDNHSRRLQQVSQNRTTENGTVMANRNSLYMNRGDDTFSQIAHYSNVDASGWSWATNFMDIDLDGFEDLIIANGYLFDYLDMETQFRMSEEARRRGYQVDDILNYPELSLKNKIYKNNMDLTFADNSEKWGFSEEDISQGMAFADFDNDGDLDILMNRFNDVASLFENKSNKKRIAVRLNGDPPNTYGIGATIELTGSDLQQSKEIVAGGSYLSGLQPMAVFAANEDNYQINVYWPDGKVSTVQDVSANRIYEIDQSSSQNSLVEVDEKNDTTVFEDVSYLLDHKHVEDEFDETVLQPLVPHKLTRQGPGVAWLDFNNDGLEDIIIGSAKDSSPALFENDGTGSFTKTAIPNISDILPADQTGVISWKEGDYTYLVTGLSTYEQNGSDRTSAKLFLIDSEQEIQEVNIPYIGASTGPVAAADVDGNGYVDLFIGGYFVPGRYPENAGSRLILNDDGNFQMDQTNVETLSSVGLVTGAVFTDYNNDNQPDLLLSTEWGSLQLFENNNGTLRNITAETNLNYYKGWWRSVATGDINNDGLTDIIATNLGLNSHYKTENNKPLRLFYHDFNGDGILSVIDSYFSEDINSYVPRNRIQAYESIPEILNYVQSFKDFSSSSVSQIFGIDFSNVPFKEINTLEHMLFLNTPEGFIARRLPWEAQISAGSHVGVLDFNNDGFEDLFLSQNYFAFNEPEKRIDAGRGLLLKGDGSGNFEALPGNLSGIKVYGDQRGAAFGDFNRDGRTDIVITQNSDSTKFYKNTSEKRGIRIHLIGPEENSTAIGSKVRLIYADGITGPVREIQSGSGYLSQRSQIQVLGTKEEYPTHIEVTWFDGRLSRQPFEEGEGDYVIRY
ncbi:MAG: FG-GAP-like repeat-containing protein [Balneolaceae bacterium]|nr:FG-GAP-like repeat-containing protein [Balneolaceae bacterium]